MLLNGTIRRKMCVGLLLVLGMLVTLSAGTLTGLNSYRRLVRELDFSIYEAPRRSDLSESIGPLFEPLTRKIVLPPPSSGAKSQMDWLNKAREVAGAHCRDFENRLSKTRSRLTDFHRRLDQLPASNVTDTYRKETEPLLAKIDAELSVIEKESRDLSDITSRRTVIDGLLRRVVRMQALSQKIPDFQSGMNESSKRANDLYKSRHQLMLVTSGVVLVLFLILTGVIYAGILAPIRKLHQGAIRVADGDFQYQLDLPRRGEMTELAEAFNRMTARFLESQQDLNRQVEERSRQLMRSERLAGIGFLAAGVAHEINNPLSAISMAAESLSSRAELIAGSAGPDDVKVVETYLGMIRRESERCEQITRKLLEFARGKAGERNRVDVTRLIAEVLDMVRPMSRYQNRGVEFFRTQPCYAELNGPEIKQVLLNIVSNALESMEDGGTLKIRIHEQTDSVHLTFEDNGCGMTDEVLQHLFEPFFTRRRDGRGTGLGMAICQRIVTDHSGSIEAESAGPGEGSTFRIHLPRRAADDASQAA